MVTIDIASGNVTHQFGYLLTAGSGVSEIVALNEHEFLVDERDGSGREANVPPGNSTNAKVKQLFKIDLSNTIDT
jgi:Esterase-like activity of phytase